ncbi:MAG: hypothetical protein ACT4OJ_05005 [Bacteroidota bacterium]
MKKLALFPLLFVLVPAGEVFAQDTLPKFSLINAGNNRIIIGWFNKFENVKQISIQRSYDSLTGYKSILTVADPTSPQNGFLDARAPNDHMFYRIYIMLDKGMYLFSTAKKPVKDTLRIARTLSVDRDNKILVDGNNKQPVILDSAEKARPVVIRLDGFPVTDSVTVPNPVIIKNKTNAFVPSLYVYTCRDGYVCIRLPDKEKSKKYSIKFFEDEIQLFELKEIKEREFKIDKANFYHAGWFRFELYEDGKLLEKHKFYLEKDF